MHLTIETLDSSYANAARAIVRADALVITAGAGMGVDSGLPDFRGREGFWRAYPPLAKLGLDFAQIANPSWFTRDPELAWGFYGHRLNLYRATTPHPGFATLLRWMKGKRLGGFVYTSNVDGHFQRAGFPEATVAECHGSIHHLQCLKNCSDQIWPAPPKLNFTVDPATCRAVGELPRCPHCGALARPNILMFSDLTWQSARSDAQEGAFLDWIDACEPAAVTVIELGAGSAIPTVRNCSEELQRDGATLIRINPRESKGLPGTISLKTGALAAINALAADA